MPNAQGIPTPADFAAARVTNPGQSEVIRQRLYDYQLLAGAGAQQLSFFQSAIGQGVTTSIGGTVGTPKTQWDTNIQLGGQLPNGISYLVESLEVAFYAGSSAAANTYTPQTLGFFAAAAAATVPAVLNDFNFFYQSGMLEFNILQKNYLRETPLVAFPPKAAVTASGAAASNSATVGESGFVAPRADGRPYYMDPNVLLQPTMNFEVLLKWPTASGLPSGFNARVGVILDGFMLRASQ